MKKLVQEKNKAIALRKKGCSYKEIQFKVPVAKSTLSLWLKNTPLTNSEKAVLKHRTNSNINRGRIKAAASLRARRLEREELYRKEANKLFNIFKSEPFFHSGIALYWAEGSKRSEKWEFNNSDPEMIGLMLCWLERYLECPRDRNSYRIYGHSAYVSTDLQEWWMQHLNIPNESFRGMSVKQSVHQSLKRVGYKGCFRIEVPKSKKHLYIMKLFIKLLVDSSHNK